MTYCARCGAEVEGGREMSRKATCPSCSGDLHICLNCRFYSETAHNNCTEPKAEHQRWRDRANFCDYFQYRQGRAQGRGARGGGSGAMDEKEAARRKLDELFGG